LANVKAIAAGYEHSLALLFVPERPQAVESQIWAWGSNFCGQLGDGSRNDRHVPVPVSSPVSEEKPKIDVWTEIAAGGSHSLALRADATVWAWGSNLNGQLGDEPFDYRPRPVLVVGLPSGLDEIKQIAAGDEHSLAITGLAAGSKVLTWGWNLYGQLGRKKKPSATLKIPPVDGLSGVVTVCGGFMHSLALCNDGTFWAWGSNLMGQLGDGTNNNSFLPVQVHGAGATDPHLVGTASSALAAGRLFSLAVPEAI
jgi:alpha-tubulin suppressor-like RCC1 family protein